MILRHGKGTILPINAGDFPRSHTLLISFRRLTPLVVLSLVSLTLWCGLTHRWSLQDWATPLQLHGDPLEIYARVQAAKEDLSQPLSGFSHLPRLGAPVGANWRRYPISDRVVFTGLGLLARGVGVFTAMNVAMAAVHVLNALGFYLCARYLRWRREWAMATALLFAFSSYNFRWGVTVSFSLTFFVPVLLLLCGWIARAAPVVRARRWTWVAAALGLWLGGANPYLTFFASQLVGGSVALQLLRRREKARWRAGLTFFAVLAVSFALHNAAYFTASTEGEARLTLSRNYAGSEIYALKLADLFIPAQDHPVSLMAQAGRAYRAQSALRTEFFVNYLGGAAILGLILLLWAALRPMAQRRPLKVPDAFLGVIWTIVFSAVGGINSLLALGGLDLFRASNRNSIFILVWALFWFGKWCQRQWRPSFPVFRFGLPLAVVLLNVADVLPHIGLRTLGTNFKSLGEYRVLMRDLETDLGPGAAVFTVPTPVFPEAGMVATMPDYELFLPYLTSSTLRLSYGALRGTPLSRSLRSLARLSAPMMRERLEATGFSAIWIDRRGVADGGVGLIDEFRRLGLKEFSHDGSIDCVIFTLNPAKQPVALDLADPRLFEPWDVILSLRQPELVVYEGWYDLERENGRSWRWAQATASTGIMMPSTSRVRLSFWAYSLERGEIVLECDGREVARCNSTPTSRDQRSVELALTAGRHRLVWRFTGHVGRPAEADGRRLGFAVENLSITVVAPPDTPPAKNVSK